MGNKPVISKQQILDTAFAIASESGLSGLSIREVARACNVAVGTVYNSYPTKYDLVNDVVGRFWNEALADMLGPDQLHRYLDDGTIEVAPLAYMRGRTLNDAYVILDEAQNTTEQQMKMFLTRLGIKVIYSDSLIE